MAEAGRVIAGRARGIHLVAPGPGTRPLADRTKQSVFAALETRLRGAAILDLCAGAGSAGIEALSRGAARAVLVDDDEGACRAIATNLARTGLGGDARVVRGDALGYLLGRLGGRGDPAADGPFDVVILDPPYQETRLRDAILGVLAAPTAPLASGALVVATAHWRSRPLATGLLRSPRERRFGETSVTVFEWVGPGDGRDAVPEVATGSPPRTEAGS